MVNVTVDTDEVAATLRDLAQHYARRLGRTARVEQVYGQGIRVRLRPTRPGAVEVGWGDVGGELEIVVGEHGWRRVGGRRPDAELIRVLCEAVIAGRGHEITAPGRALVVLTPAEAPAMRMIHRTGWAGLIPLPAWTRWGHRTPWEPYG
jgi:hypothetical protein